MADLFTLSISLLLRNDYICGNCEHPCGGRRHRPRSCVRRGAAGKSAWNGFQGAGQPGNRLGTTSKGPRRPEMGFETTSKGLRSVRRGLKPVPRLHAACAEVWNHFQGAFPASDGRKSSSKGRRRLEEVEKAVPRRFTRRRRCSLSQFFREPTPELSDHRHDLPQ